MMKNKVCYLILICILINFVFVSATVEIEKKAIKKDVVAELRNPALFSFTLKNVGASDNFEIYTLVGVKITPDENIIIMEGEEKKVDLEFYLSEENVKKRGLFNFIYKIKGVKSGIQEEVLSVNVVSLENSFEISSSSISPESETATVYVKNKLDYDFDNVKMNLKSAFFEKEEEFSLKAGEKKEFKIEIDSEKMKKLIAGSYIITGETEVDGHEASSEGVLIFTEKSGLIKEESSKGVLIVKRTITQTNEGNLPVVAEIEIKKNAMSRLFTNFNYEPTNAERSGFSVLYTFKKEIKPSEVFAVTATTNWFYPLILLIAVILTGYLVSIYTSSFVVLRKKSTFVKTKGGEFALKITLVVKARKFVEGINVIDKIPGIVKVHKRFGSVEPDKIDEKNRRLEWNIPSLQEGEERVFSYVVYSKIGVVGKFEIPPATAVYEKDGKSHEATSNKVYFLNETRMKED